MDKVTKLLQKKPYSWYLVPGANYEDEVIRIIIEYTAMKLDKDGMSIEALLKELNKEQNHADNRKTD